MKRDQYGPPPGLSEGERVRWQQARKFVWMPGDLVIVKRGDGKKSGEDAHEGRDTEQPRGSGAM